MSQVPLAPPPQTGQPIDSWLYLLWRRLTQAGQILWASITPGTSADVAAVVTDETGSPGSLVFSANPTVQGITVDGIFYQGDVTPIVGPALLGGMFSTDTASGYNLILRKAFSGTQPPGVGFFKARGTAASPSVVSAGDQLGSFNFVGHDGSSYSTGVTVTGVTEGTIGTSKMPAHLKISTADASSGVVTEGLRIDSSRVVTLGGVNTAPALKVTPVASQARWVEVTGATSSGNPQLATNAGELLLPQNIVLPKTSGKGIQVDTASPSFGWRDIIGQIGVKTAGATDPVWTLYRGAMYAYTFDTATAEAFLVFHIPHDYVPGSDLFAHVHWSQKVVDTGGTAGVPGVAEWKFDISYADGHGTAGGAADPFIAPITVTVTQQASTTQYGHMIAEVQFTNNGGTGGLIDSNTIQVDGLLLVRLYRVKANPADTLNQAPFVHTADIHYQSTNIGTKQKAPNFYT